MSHITLEEYIAELPQSLTRDEKIARANEWKQSHAPKSETIEVVEEGKPPVVTEESTTVATATPNVQAALSGIGEFGIGGSVLPFTNPYNQSLDDIGRNISDDLFRGGLSLEDYEKQRSEYEEKKKLYNEAIEDFEFKKQEQEKGFQAIESGEIKYDTRVLIKPPKGTRFKEGSSKEFTFNEIQQMIDSNQPGFEGVSTVADYVKLNPNAEIISYTSQPMEGTVTVLDQVSLDPYNISDIEETLGNNVWNLTGNDLISNEIVVKDNISGIDEDYFFTLGSEREAQKEKNDGSTAINIGKVEKYRTERLGKQASLDFSNITFDNILDSGTNLLTKKEIEFINLPKEKQNEIAKDENYGEALFFGDNLINIDLEDVPEAQLELFEKSNKMATTTEVGVLKNKLKQEYFNLVGLAREIYNYDVKNEKPSMRISGYLNDPKFLSKYADSKYFVGFNDEQKNLIKEIATTGKLPKNLGLDDFKDGIVMPGVMNFEDQESGHPLIKEFNNTLKDYRIINRALLLNRDPLTTEQDGFWSSAAKRTSEILGLNVDTEFEKQGEYLTWIKANGFVPSETAMKNDLFVRLPNGSFNIEEKFASQAGAGAIDLTKWIGETYLFTRLTGNFVAKSQKALNLAWKNSKNLQKIPYAVSAFTGATNILAQSTTFTGGTLVSQYLDGEFDIEELRSSAGFGASLATGHLAYDPFVNYLRKSKFGRMFSPVVDRLTRYAPNTYKRVSRSVGGGFTGATTYQIGGVINQGGIRDADGNITISLKTQSLEFIKMVAAGVFTKAIPNFQTIKKEFKSDIISVKNRGNLDLEARKSAAYLGVNEKSVTDVDENSLDNLNKAFNEKVDNLIARKRKGEITKEEADAEFKILKENYRVIDTQIAVNSAYKMIKAEESSGNAPKESEFYIVAGKIKNGDKLNERDGEVLSYYGLDGVGMLYKRLGIQKNSANDRYLQGLIMNESLIDAQLNGKSFILTPYGLQPINPTEFVSPKGTPARANTREFLRKRLELDTQISRLKKLDTKNLSESELLKHKNSIKKKQEELEQYVEGGKLYDNIQSEIQGAAITAYEKDIKQADPSEGKVVEAKTPEEFQKLYDESGFKAEDVKGKIAFTDKDGNKVINREFALQQRNFTPVTHEIPHSILKDSFKDAEGNVTPEGIEMIDGVLNKLTPRQKQVLDQELASRYDVGQSKEKWYEENITVLAELIKRGEIEFSKSFGEGLAGLVPAFKSFLPNIEVNPETGKGIFDMLKAQDLGRVKIKETPKKVEVETTTENLELVPPFSESKKEVKNKAQELIIKSKSGKKLTREEETELQTQLEILALDALGFQQGKGTATRQEALSFVNQYIPGIIRRFDPKRNLQISTLLFRNISPKKQRFYGEELQLEKRGVESSLADERVGELTTEETKTETVAADIAKKPTETTRFSENLLTTEFKENNDTSKKGIENKITETIVDGYKGRDVSGFKDLGSPKFPIPKSVAKLYADMFGIKTVDGLIKKAQNFYPRDRDGLRQLQRFLLENSLSDYNRLPKTISDLGKATGIKQTKLGKIMYNDKGVKVGTHKQYRDIMQGKNVTLTIQNGPQKGKPIEFNKAVKDISRGDLQQNLKTAWDAHVKNRALEVLIPEQGKRIQAGAKFSEDKKVPKITTGKERENLGYTKPSFVRDKIFEKSKKTGALKGYTIIDTKSSEYKAAVKDFKSFFEFYPEGKRYVEQSMTGGRDLTFRDIPNFESLFGKSNRDNKATRFTYAAAEMFLAGKVNKGLRDGSILRNNKFRLDEIENFYLKVQEFLKTKQGKGKYRIFEQFLRDSAKGQGHLNRFGAALVFYPINTLTGKAVSVKVKEEHMAPVNKIGLMLLEAAKRGTVKEEFKDIKAIYGQGALRYNDDKALSVFLDKNLPPEYYDKVLKAVREGKLDFLPQGTASLIRYTIENTIDPFAYAFTETQKSIGEFFVGKSKKVTTPFEILENSKVVNELITKVLTGEITRERAKKDYQQLQKVVDPKAKSAEKMNDLASSSFRFDKAATNEAVVENLRAADAALELSRSLNIENGKPVPKKEKKIRVFDFDDTLARSNSKVSVEMPGRPIDIEMLDVAARRIFKKEFENKPSFKQNFKDLNEEQQARVLKDFPSGETFKINATEFAKRASELESKGAKFDFSEFSKVVDGKKGPLFDVAKKIADARGTEDLFVLTARPQDAAGPIKEFMKALGIDIPLKNITGLADGKASAKGRWIMDKVSEGYNDFYFADDALKNVEAVKEVLDQADVKGKVQQAKFSNAKTFNAITNEMIEASSGIEAYKTFSAAKARTLGENKGRFDWLTMASSAEDFKGLLYKMLGKGKQGEAHFEFLKTNLIDPYNRAEDSAIQAKISAANDFMALKSMYKTIPTTLKKETGVGKFTYQHALRTYMWTKQGMSIPGLSKADLAKLNKFVTDSAELQTFADQLIVSQKGKMYPEPGKDWLAGNLTTDIIGGINKVNRAEYQKTFRENVDIIFSPENLNKMEAAYGTRWRKALEDTLRRMKSGSNRPIGGSEITNKVLDWTNNSVGAVMFLNTRSALLQTISAVNFLNWGDNNPIAAGKAFANQKQFWGDFMTLMNSDYLVQRRNGLKINVSESEIADAVKDSKNKVNAAISYLLSKGFVLTRYADSFAIASGGSTFYRNRIKKYIKEGMSTELAEQQAFADFKDVAEESQQSSDASKISMQQASGAGRVILNWANTPMQYVRIQKRAAQDLINGRGDWKTNVSKIAYYGAIQNLIFNSLQQALFAIGFGSDEDEKDPKIEARNEKKITRVANGMIDSQLKGLGIAGNAMVAAKNTVLKIIEESGKKRPEYEKAAIEALSFSPAISSKYRKIVGGLKSFSWNAKEIKEKGFSLDNPAYLAGAQIFTAFTNIPLDRVVKKTNNIRGILSEQTAEWQKISLAAGYGTYDIGLPYYGGWDAVADPTPEEIEQKKFDTMKKDTKTQDQIDMLLDLGLTKNEIKALGKEDARVKKIIELQSKIPMRPTEQPEETKTKPVPETKPTPEIKPPLKPKPTTETAEQKLRRQFDSIKAENKPDQVKTLTKFGLTKKEIRDLRYEKNRVEKILELMDK